jgi:hypothetical protein
LFYRKVESGKSDEILFAEDTDEKIELQGKWKVLIVDDEPEVHGVTE